MHPVHHTSPHRARLKCEKFWQPLYDPAQDPIPIQEGSAIPVGKLPIVDDADQECSTEFAYEADLRNYLAKNLPMIEPGLKLYQDEGITGVEFDVGGRRIDILAIDAKGDLVVIELKVCMRPANYRLRDEVQQPNSVRRQRLGVNGTTIWLGSTGERTLSGQVVLAEPSSGRVNCHCPMQGLDCLEYGHRREAARL